MRRTDHTRLSKRPPARRPGDKSGDLPLTPLLVNMMSGRSGSTLVMQLLDRPQIAFDRVYPFEHPYLTYLAHMLVPVGEPFAVSPEWGMVQMLRGDPYRGPIPFAPLGLDPRQLRVRLIRHGWAALSESLSAFAGRELTYYAEKATGHTLPLLTEAGIRAKVVNLVRDPRDVVCSIRAFDARRGFYGFGRAEEMSDDEYLSGLVTHMRELLTEMQTIDQRHDCMYVRYEDLVTNLGSVCTSLSEFLGVEIVARDDLREGEIVDIHSTSSSVAASVGRWRRELSGRDAEFVMAGLRDHMVKFGYNLDPANDTS